MPKHAKRNTRKIVVALLCIIAILMGALPVALGVSLDSVQVMSAPLMVKSGATNGMVRVYLSSLGNPSTLNLTIVGNYSINGNTKASLSSGASVTVGFSSSTGAITLTSNGTKTNMGTYFALRRHSATGTNGIKISQAKESDNPYPGDLSFRAVNQGGSYKLYTVAHIYIENYLYGVLPYEMGNSTNVEALKAQAVAARTYTVRMMASRSSGYYDVVDTTNDQVYRGTPSGNANCVAAVNGTKGVVVMNGSGYTATYYSASNGGQMDSIRNVWGTSGYDYLRVKDDPFDYANPSSTVKSTTINSNLTSGSNNSALMNLLKSKAAGKLGGSASSIILNTLKSVTPHTPKFASPSRLYTKVDFTMVASTPSKANATVTVTCDIFSELESMLSMGIQSSQNELWSVQKSGTSFVLQARRYGHGLGMSQRGAVYMAKLGYTYDQILGFYYNDCKRVRNSFTNTILSASGDEQTTVEDPADLTDEDLTACRGTVKLINASTALAIRRDKSVTSDLIGTAGNGAIVSVLSSDGTWCFIKFGNLKGYVPANALQMTGTPSGEEETPTSIIGFVTVTASDFVNLRESDNMSANVLSTAPARAVLTVFSKSGSWAHVQYNATVAYVNTSYISPITTAYPGKVSSTGSATATITIEGGTGTANLRASASTSAEILASLPHGTEITVSSDDGSWCIVNYNGKMGYLLSEYVVYSGDSLDNNSGGSGDDNPGVVDPAGVKAIVCDEIGYLRTSQSIDAPSVQLIDKGETVLVTLRASEWCDVSYDGDTGYMLTSSLSFDAGGSGGTVAKAIVTTASGSLNMRSQATAGSHVITTIPHGAEVDITEMGSEWCGVRYNGYSGYAMACFLTIKEGGNDGDPTDPTFPTEPIEPTPTPPPSVNGESAIVTTQSGSLNLRAEARAGSSILRTIPQYASVTVHESGAEWCRVTYQNTTGYVMSVFLTFSNENPDTNPDGETDKPDTDGDEDTDGDINNPDIPITPDTGDENTLYAVVNTVSGSLNLRRDALPGSDVIARIPKGATVVISQKLAAWSETSYGGQVGYVMNAYLSFRQGKPDVSEGDQAMVNTLSGSLNLRTEPSQNSGVLTRIPQYAMVSVQQRGAAWCSISYHNHFGYVMTQFLAFSKDGSENEPTSAPQDDGTGDTIDDTTTEPPTNDSDLAYVSTTSGSLNLRMAPNGSGKILTTMPQNAAVSIISYGDTWCQVTYHGITGYAMTVFLRFDTALVAPPSQQPSEDTPSTDTQTIAWVLTPSGSLNLRESPKSGSHVLLTIPRLAEVTLIKNMGDWGYVQYNNQHGYVASNYLTQSNPSAQAGDSGQDENTSPDMDTGEIDYSSGIALDITLEAPAELTLARIAPKKGMGELALYNQCFEGMETLEKMPMDTQVEMILKGDTWCMVQYGDTQGYCLSKYLAIIKEP